MVKKKRSRIGITMLAMHFCSLRPGSRKRGNGNAANTGDAGKRYL